MGDAVFVSSLENCAVGSSVKSFMRLDRHVEIARQHTILIKLGLQLFVLHIDADTAPLVDGVPPPGV